jgi:hypothetical protein
MFFLCTHTHTHFTTHAGIIKPKGDLIIYCSKFQNIFLIIYIYKKINAPRILHICCKYYYILKYNLKIVCVLFFFNFKFECMCVYEKERKYRIFNFKVERTQQARLSLITFNRFVPVSQPRDSHLRLETVEEIKFNRLL